MSFNPKDHYFKKAKKEGYAARSAYKLEEIDQKHRILRGGQSVLDLGCAPGSWSQYVSKKIGPQGKLFGIDLKPVNVKAPQAKFVVGDIFATPLTAFEWAPYDVVLSDMAPNTTGIVMRDKAASEELCRKVLDLAQTLLKPRGALVMKIFMSNEVKDIENLMKKKFQKVHYVRPQSVRKVSYEIFLVGLNYTP